MDLSELQTFIKVTVDRGGGAYQSYQTGKIDQQEFKRSLELIADGAAQDIADSYDD